MKHAFSIAASMILCFAAFAEATTTITAPSPASGIVTVTAKTATSKLTTLSVYVDSVLMRSCSTATCTYSWNTRTVGNGQHTVMARRLGLKGALEQSARTVSVSNDVTAPSVTLQAPTNASGTVDLLATATDASGVASIEIRAGGQTLATAPGGGISTSWNTTSLADGTYTVQAFATDKFGNQGASAPTSVVVLNTVAATAPSPSSAIKLLTGPLAALGASGLAGIGIYDANALASGVIYAAGFPSTPDDVLSSNYYDLAYTLYNLYYRTHDSAWLNRARSVARAWRDAPNNQEIEQYLAGDYSVGGDIPPGRGMATLGLAILAIESNDAEARRIVNDHARLVEEKWGIVFSDAREAGYSLMALVASTIVGDDHRASARQMLDVILSQQKSDGHWEYSSDLVPNNQPFVLNYMTGLLMEALALYDRAIGDPRILPAVQRSIDWTWNTQWLASDQSFQYGNIDSGTVNTHAANDLNGLMLPAWGYAFSKTGDARYRTQGDQIFAGMMTMIPGVLTSEKHFAQIYRSSGQYPGALAPLP